MLTTQQIAALRGVRPVTVRHWVTSKQLPATRYGRDWLIREEDWATFDKAKKPTRAGRPRKPQDSEHERRADPDRPQDTPA